MSDEIGPQNRRRVQKRRRRFKDWKPHFLRHFAMTCNVAASARKAKVAPSTPYMARMRDPVFAGDWQTAQAQGYARLEAAQVRQATLSAEKVALAIARGAAAPAAAIDPRIGLHLLQLHGRGLGKAGGDIQPGRSDIESARARLEKKMRILLISDQSSTLIRVEGSGDGSGEEVAPPLHFMRSPSPEKSGEE